MNLEKLVNGKQIVAIVCNQWGDTGKGKFSDYFSQWADVCARGTGGNNAGHTVVVKGQKTVFHLIPAGIVNDGEGKSTILGNGMVIDLRKLSQELDQLEARGQSYNNLMISKDAHVIMPYHVARDCANDKDQTKGGIGSTGRGIGPAYTDKIARRGITIGNLFNVDKLNKIIENAKSHYPEQTINTGDIIDELNPHILRVKGLVRDTTSVMHRYVKNGYKILLEGAQGVLLSIEHGTYPYVTSSDCSINGTASGVGIPAHLIDLPLGVVKFPFMTRVGGGPFPTELGGRQSEEYCKFDSNGKAFELSTYEIPHTISDGKISYNLRDSKILKLMNSKNDFERGVGIRLAADEYGATTGRPRRTGWVDAEIAKYAVGINGPLMILTKADAIAGMDEFRIGYAYKFSRDADKLSSAVPNYKSYPGFDDISNVREYDDLPTTLTRAIGDFEKISGGRVVIVSNGPDREQTIVR